MLYFTGKESLHHDTDIFDKYCRDQNISFLKLNPKDGE